MHGFVGPLIPLESPFQIELVCFEIGRAFHTYRGCGRQLGGERLGYRRRNLVLNRKDVFQIPIVPFRPQVVPVRGVH